MGGISIEEEQLCMQINITNQTSLFSHSRLPWKCHHKDCHGNLLITQPLPSTSHLPGTVLELNDFLQKCDISSRNIILLQSHFYAQTDRQVALDRVYLVCFDMVRWMQSDLKEENPCFYDDLLDEWFGCQSFPSGGITLVLNVGCPSSL